MIFCWNNKHKLIYFNISTVVQTGPCYQCTYVYSLTYFSRWCYRIGSLKAKWRINSLGWRLWSKQVSTTQSYNTEFDGVLNQMQISVIASCRISISYIRLRVSYVCEGILCLGIKIGCNYNMPWAVAQGIL